MGEFCPRQTETHMSGDGSRASPVPVRNISQLSESGFNEACVCAHIHMHTHESTHTHSETHTQGITHSHSLTFFIYNILQSH